MVVDLFSQAWRCQNSSAAVKVIVLLRPPAAKSSAILAATDCATDHLVQRC